MTDTDPHERRSKDASQTPAPPDTADSGLDAAPRPLLDELRGQVPHLDPHPTGPAEAGDSDDCRAAAERLYQQASAVREHAMAEFERVKQLRAEFAQREADYAQALREIDQQRAQLESDRAELLSEFDDLAHQRSVFDQQLAHRRLRTTSARRIRRTSRLALHARLVTLALIAALIAGGAWVLMNTRDQVESVARIQIDGDMPLAICAAQLASLGGRPHADAAGSAWHQAVSAGRVIIGQDDPTHTLKITLRGPSPVDNEQTLSTAAARFAQMLPGLSSDPAADVSHRVWAAQRKELDQRLAALRNQRSEVQRQRAAVPRAESAESARAALAELQTDAQRITERHTSARDALRTLEDQVEPTGTVSTEDFARGLSDDAIYQQDSAEFEMQTKAYQRELVLSEVLVLDKLEDLQAAAAELATTIDKQLSLDLPLSVRALLEDAGGEADDFDRLLRQFIKSWNTQREATERLHPTQATRELFTAQTEAVQALGRVLTETTRVSGKLRLIVDQISHGNDAPTRRTVIGSLLRGELRHIDQARRDVRQVAEGLDTATNFKLDAADRLVRNLSTRLREREKRIRTKLQAAADRDARAQHANAVQQQRAVVADLDQQRETALARIVDQLDLIQSLQETARRTAALDARAASLDEQIEQLTQQQARLDQHEPAVHKTTARLVRMAHAPVDMHRHLQAASIVALGVFAGVWIVGTLIFGRFARAAPRHRNTTKP